MRRDCGQMHGATLTLPGACDVTAPITAVHVHISGPFRVAWYSMTEAVLPASANWFSAHAVDVLHDTAATVLAAAAKHMVFVVKLARKKPEYIATLVGFKKGSKVAAVCLVRNEAGETVVRTAAGRQIRGWTTQNV